MNRKKTLDRSLAFWQGFYFLREGENVQDERQDILYWAAEVWMKLTEYHDVFTIKVPLQPYDIGQGIHNRGAHCRTKQVFPEFVALSSHFQAYIQQIKPRQNRIYKRFIVAFLVVEQSRTNPNYFPLFLW